MGQYHRPVSLERMECLHPHDMGDGLKLLEQGLSPSATLAALGLWLTGEGRWAGTRIGFIGDYSEDSDLSDAALAEGHTANALWTTRDEAGGSERSPLNVSDEAAADLIAAGVWSDLPDRSGYGWARPIVNEDYTAAGYEGMIVNFDRGEAIDPAGLGDSRLVGSFSVGGWGGAMTALTILLAASCKGGARGGGDFHPNEDTPYFLADLGTVGLWAWDRIGIVPFPPAGTVEGLFADITPAIRDVMARGHIATYVPDGEGWSRILRGGEPAELVGLR